ncbi:hypothetical protein FA95DRAFT_1562212 [Auriscalpium vulgare]|uniref:Uncharacterized protein n=1 Tax=Auriscalpium vulgare TaxID=40419 RepID=A0ACB8RK14_9AGAM|nr:hypothetical protein FA95DRAFT_1562212 [Auriscalpium vulgare]
MWDAFLDPADKPGRDCESEKGWADVQPVAALVVQDAASEHAPPPSVPRRPFALFRRASPPPPAPTVPWPEAGADAPPPVPVQVAVLVAMPMPRSGSGAVRDALPVLEIAVGVARGRIEETVRAKES